LQYQKHAILPTLSREEYGEETERERRHYQRQNIKSKGGKGREMGGLRSPNDEVPF